jgi:hypothetical protein
MKKNLPILFVFIALAASWSGWLAYQAYTVADPVVVSAPQLQLASVVAIVQVLPAKQGAVTARIVKAYKDELQPVRKLPAEIQVAAPIDEPLAEGMYVLALRQIDIEKNLYEIAPIPFIQTHAPPPIYPNTESVRLQTERILNGK